MMEIWKDIKGYEGHYQVSNLGRIKSLMRYRKGKKGAPTYCPERIIAPNVHKKTGYAIVHLTKDNKYKAMLIHRIVAEHFVDNSENKPVVDHINGNRLDNSASNLRWCTTKENMNFNGVRKNISIVQKTSVACIKHTKEIQDLRKRPITVIFPSGNVEEFESARAAEIKYGFNHSLIAACCNGKQRTHHKCQFSYKV